MGIVFRARDLQTNATVAVKLLGAGTDADLTRARREAQLLARLAHPAIVTHIDDGVLPDGRLYLAMEWVDGETVGERIAGDGFTLAEAVGVARRVAAALGAAHAAGILHRDVKPSNVLLSGATGDAVKLIDFGVARPAHGKSLTRTGTAIGTPGYMAPEQARGVRALTPAADVFGLGCVFYECATGRPAFSGMQRAAVLAKVLFAEPQPFATHCPDAPPALVELVARMLDKDPARRCADGNAVAAALAAIDELPVTARRAGGALAAPTAPVTTAAGRCLVLASQGLPEEPEAELEVGDELERAVAAVGATITRLDNGVVLAHVLGGVVDVARRAARCALTMRELLPRCAIAVSPVSAEPSEAADRGAELLTTAAMASIFGSLAPGEIVVDPRTAELIGDAFEIEHGVHVVLRGVKRP